MRKSMLFLGPLMAVAGLAALTWFVLMPQYRPGLSAGERYGVDVSNHQGSVDWPAVAANDIDFAYLKATEGATFVDASFLTNWSGTQQAGLRRGAYHFFTLCSPGDAQARHFLATAPPTPGSLPPAIDLELAGNCSARPPAEDVKREVTALVDAVEAATGQKTLLYVGDDFEAQYRVDDWLDRERWQPRFFRRPGTPWVVWQVSGFARVDGIEGRADLDVARPGF